MDGATFDPPVGCMYFMEDPSSCFSSSPSSSTVYKYSLQSPFLLVRSPHDELISASPSYLRYSVYWLLPFRLTHDVCPHCGVARAPSPVPDIQPCALVTSKHLCVGCRLPSPLGSALSWFLPNCAYLSCLTSVSAMCLRPGHLPRLSSCFPMCLHCVSLTCP